MCMSGCITFLQALWGCRYLFTLVLHVVRSRERLSDRSIPLVAVFLTGLLLTHERTLCAAAKSQTDIFMADRSLAKKVSCIELSLPLILCGMFCSALLCSNIIKDSKHGGFCSKHLWVSEEPKLKRCTGFAPVPRLFEESASGGRIDKQMSTSLKRTPSKILRCKVWCGEVHLYL